MLSMLCSGYVVAQQHNQQQIQKLNYLYSYLRNNYVDELDLEPLVDEAIRATIEELDPHSSYLTREEMANLQRRLRGEFAGVGIKYILHNDTIVVRGTIPNSPAERADIRPNDRITTVNGESVIGISSDSVRTLLRGEPKTKVNIGIARRGESKLLNIKLQRSTIESSAISSAYRLGNIGYIAISAFSKPLAAEFMTAYRELDDAEALIVDLRNNAGGAITSAIDLTELFLSKGDVVVSTEGRTTNAVYTTKRDGILADVPIVVIINENSASASEIFAGAIQDHDRGVIIGRTSYGKGLVQRVVDFKDGTGLCITIARYKTPSGRIIQRPYTMGEGEEYKSDSLRYKHADSISYAQRPQYTTLKSRRVVYGGGGITPDIYTDGGSTPLSAELSEAYNNALFEHCAIEIFDGVSIEELRGRYPTVEAFSNEYTLSDTALGIFYESAGLRGEALSEYDVEFVTTMLMAAMAEQLYGDNARSYIYCTRFDLVAKRAYEVAADDSLMRDILKRD